MRRKALAFTLAALVCGATLDAEASPPTAPSESPLAKWDPIESLNRSTYRFNIWLDRWLLLPVVQVYRNVPEPARNSVRNFFANLDELPTLANTLLQGSPVKASTTVARFALNTTVGVAGVFDPASRWGLIRYQEDFGQTLGRWGVGSGPYVVLPFFGPSSLRDTVGIGGDRAMLWALGAATIDELNTAFAVLTPAEVVSLREANDFRYAELGPFEYELVRYTYLEYRKVLVGE